MTRVKDLHKEWMKNPKYVEEYNKLEPEFALARAFIKARIDAGLTQAELADKMHTKQSVVSRLESGKFLPSISTLKRFAEVTGTRLKISFDNGLHTA